MKNKSKKIIGEPNEVEANVLNPLLHNIPNEIVKAAQVLEYWFEQNGHGGWEFMGIADRRLIAQLNQRVKLLEEDLKHEKLRGRSLYGETARYKRENGILHMTVSEMEIPEGSPRLLNALCYLGAWCAAMRSACEDVLGRIISEKLSWGEIDTIRDALSGTAGKALLAQVEKMRAELAKLKGGAV